MRIQSRNRNQLGLALSPTAGELTEEALRVAYRLSGLTQPFELAMSNPALAIAIRNSALAMMRSRR